MKKWQIRKKVKKIMYLKKKTYCYFFIQDYCRYDFFNPYLQQIKEQKTHS